MFSHDVGATGHNKMGIKNKVGDELNDLLKSHEFDNSYNKNHRDNQLDSQLFNPGATSHEGHTDMIIKGDDTKLMNMMDSKLQESQQRLPSAIKYKNGTILGGKKPINDNSADDFEDMISEIE